MIFTTTIDATSICDPAALDGDELTNAVSAANDVQNWPSRRLS